MRIDYLKIENFKSFETFEIELNPDSNFNIIYGINGVGKTSLLKALSVAVGSFFLKMSEVEKRNIEDDEVRMAMVMEKLEYQFPVRFHIKGSALGKKFDIVRTQQTFSGGLTMKDATDITQLSLGAVDIAQNGKEEILPVIAYFSSKRLFVTRKTSTKDKRPLGRLVGYFNSLKESNIKNEIEEWLRLSVFVSNVDSKNKEVLNSVHGYKSIFSILSTIFPEQYEVFGYMPPLLDSRYPSGIFLKDVKTQQLVPLDMLSDGYQNIFMLVLEIAWRCCQLNPFLGEEVFSRTPGVVLIDEIDLHLHPQLQEKIVGILNTTFPAIQFITTTHSPLVLASYPADVYVLEDNKLIKQEKLYAKNASFVIQRFMNAPDRPIAIQEKMTQYFNLIQAGKANNNEAKKLRQELDLLDDPKMAEADVIIQFMED